MEKRKKNQTKTYIHSKRHRTHKTKNVETRAKVAPSTKKSMPPKIMMKSQEMPEKNSKSNLSKCPTTSKWI